MNRKVLGGVAALLVVLVGVWFLWLRGDKDDDGADTNPDDKRTGEVKLPTPNAPKDDPDGRIGPAPRWSLDPDPEGPLPLEGQVVGPDKKPIGGAEVWLASVPPRSTKSEDDGTFSFDKLVGRTYQLTASSGDMIGGPVVYKLTASSDPVIIQLGEGAAVIVTVTDEAKQPLENADIMLGDMSRKTARTDAKGVATLRPVRPGWVGVQATASGYAPSTAYATVGSAGSTGKVSIVLRKGFAVSGRVIDETGKPLVKVRINASGGLWDDWMEDDDSDQRKDRNAVHTDDKGAFTIAALANGAHTLFAVDGEHASSTAKVTVANAPVTGVEITMKAGGVVTGTVVDSAGNPVPFATVKLAGAGAQMWRVAARQTTTDKAGTFELRGLARDQLTARAESDQAASKLTPIDLASQAKQEVKLVLDVTGMISGIVVDDKGSPVPEVTVNAFPDLLSGESSEGIALAGMSSATSDGAGSFAIRGIPDGSYRLWASRAARAFEWGERGTVAKAGDKNVRVVLATGGTLIGKLSIAGGTAPKIAHVQLGWQAPTPAVDGAFTIKDITPGPYTVTIRGPEFAEFVKHDIEVKPGTTTDLGSITLNRGRKLAGKVVDGSGNPVASARIKVGTMLIDAEGADGTRDEQAEQVWGVRSAVSDASGTFTITGLPQKATNVYADHDSGRSLSVAVPEGTDDPPPVTLALRGFGSISGVVMQKGKPMAKINVGASSKGAGAQAVFAETDEQGQFKLSKVPEGPVSLQAMQQAMMSMKSTSVNVTVTAGRETKVTIDIPVGQITLVVDVKALPSHKVDAAQVFLFAGMVAPANAKQLTDGIFQNGVQGMKIWFGPGKPLPDFAELLAGEFSVCTIPLTGDLMTLQQKAQQHMDKLKVYCKQVKITAAPTKQTVVHEVPSMEPLPN